MMKQLSPNKYESVRSLFDKDYPNLPLIHGIIEQLMPGQVWVDNESNPTLCLIMTEAPYCFMAGNFSEEAFKEYFDILKQKQFIKLAIKPEPLFDLSEFDFIPVLRRQYKYKDIYGEIPVYQNDTHYLIQKIENLETINLCLWKSLMVSMFGSVERFLQNGIGFILWDSKNNVIASESYGILSKEFVEVGTVTHENYRGQNLSTILCNHLIQYLVQENLHPVWSCDEANIASWKVAEKQGMNELIKYTFFVRTK